MLLYKEKVIFTYENGTITYNLIFFLLLNHSLQQKLLALISPFLLNFFPSQKYPFIYIPEQYSLEEIVKYFYFSVVQ